MLFNQFLSLIESCNELLMEVGEIAWKPEQVADFKNVKGITSDPATTRLDRRIDVDQDQYLDNRAQEEKPTMAQPKQGDVVLVQDHAGNQTPGVIVSIKSGNAQIVNNKKGMNLTRPVDGFGIAPPALTLQIQKGSANAERTVWIYRG